LWKVHLEAIASSTPRRPSRRMEEIA
jgi:hypothetical protein